MIPSRYVVLMLILILSACTQGNSFIIDDAVFSQEAMAHAATLGTMYLSTNTDTGDHNCDDDPSACCVAGYHFCDVNEFMYGGREMETTGTDRTTAPYDTKGDIDSVGSAYDCTDWTTAASALQRTAKYSTTASITAIGNNCNTADSHWCCSR